MESFTLYKNLNMSPQLAWLIETKAITSHAAQPLPDKLLTWEAHLQNDADKCNSDGGERDEQQADGGGGISSINYCLAISDDSFKCGT